MVCINNTVKLIEQIVQIEMRINVFDYNRLLVLRNTIHSSDIQRHEDAYFVILIQIRNRYHFNNQALNSNIAFVIYSSLQCSSHSSNIMT